MLHHPMLFTMAAIGTVIIRDLGLFAASVALLVDSFPDALLERLRRRAQ